MIFMSVFLQFFGSPFLKSTFLFWGLMFGCFVAGISTYEGKGSVWDKLRANVLQLLVGLPDDKVIASQGHMKQGRQYNYFNNYRIRNAPVFTFLWAETFPLGFAPEYFLPILIGFFVSTAETIGDVTMLSSKYSKLEHATGQRFRETRQGGAPRGRLNSFLACLFTSPPNTTFSQNNGVIALTQCASRSAGFACAFWLILFGVFGKLGAAFNSIPICVVGGVVLQAFSRPRCPLLHTSRRRSRGARNDLSRFPSRSDGLCLGHVHRDEARDAPQRLHPHAVDGPRHRRRHGTATFRGRRRGVLLREEPAAQHWVLAPLQDVQDVPGRARRSRCRRWRAGAHVHERQRRVLLCAEAKISRRAPPDSPVDFHTGAAPSTTRARTRTGRRRSSS